MSTNLSPDAEQDARRKLRVMYLCALATGAGLVTMMSLVIAIRSWHGEQESTLFDFLMPVVFAFIFYRLVGSAFVAVTGTQAPWSYEAIFKKSPQKPPAP